MDKLKQEQHDPIHLICGKAHQLFDRSTSKLELHTKKGKLKLNQIFNDAKVKRIYVYWPSSVRIEKNFAQGLERAASVHAFKTDGKVFLDVDQPRSVNNIIFFPEICLKVILA